MTRVLVLATVLLALVAPVSAAPRHRRGKRCARKSTAAVPSVAASSSAVAAPISSGSAVASAPAASGSAVQVPVTHNNASLLAEPEENHDPSQSGSYLFAAAPSGVAVTLNSTTNSTSANSTTSSTTVVPTSANATSVLPTSSNWTTVEPTSSASANWTTVEPTSSASANSSAVSSLVSAVSSVFNSSTTPEPTSTNATIVEPSANVTTSANATSVSLNSAAPTSSFSANATTVTASDVANVTSPTNSTSADVASTSSNISASSTVSSASSTGSSTPTPLPTGPQTGPADQQTLLVDLHNTLRAEFSAPPVTWNDSLAEYAASWATHCTLQNSAGAAGENLAAGAGNYDLTALFNYWSSEQNQYDWNNPGMVGKDGSSRVGHFTQAVWQDTTSIGCAWISSCAPNTVFQGIDSTILLICEYWPHGNVVVPNNVNWTQQWFETNVGPKLSN